MTSAPSVKPFDYVLIPAEQSIEVQSRRFEGTDDEQLRGELASYFRQGKSLTDGQKDEFAKNLQAQIAAKQQQQQGGASASASPAPPVDEKLFSEAVRSSTFEIVPVTLPSLQNRFRATSLYIDDAGRFKELPLNYRASKLAGRDIRGDAFLLSNHDDPAADDWCRVDTTKEDFEALFANPPGQTLDTGNQAQMTAASMMRESQARLVSEEDAAIVLQRKAEGNALFTQGNVDQAIDAYSQAIEKSSARLDRLPNEDEVRTARKLSYLNRAQCHLMKHAYSAAKHDAEIVISVDATNPKAWYRLAVAEKGLKDFEASRAALRQCAANGGLGQAELDTAMSELAALEKQLQNEQRKRFAGMFGGE